MDRKLVESAFDDLRLLAFPHPPEDPDLADWILELLELDGFYAGLATSVLGGSSRVAMPRRDELDSLRTWLGELRVATDEDESILEHCRRYLHVLERLHDSLLADTVGMRSKTPKLE